MIWFIIDTKSYRLKSVMLIIIKNYRKCKNSMYIGSKRSTVPMPDLHVLNSNCQVKMDFLYPLRNRAPPPELEAHECCLAGQPKVLSNAALQIREDIFEKWNEKPEKDIYREMVKHKFTF